MIDVTGTLQTADGSPQLRIERTLGHPVERVWRAVSDPAELARWFVASVAWTPAAGETFEAYGESGEVLAVDPPHRLSWRWGDEQYAIELSPDGDGCRLLLVHTFGDRALSAQHAAGWETYLDRLAALLGGGELTEEAAHDIVGDLHERYAARLGLDPAVGRQTIAGMAFRDLELIEDGPSVQLRRRYAHPLERVWRAISEPGELEQWFPELHALEVTRSEPPHLLEGTWFGEPLRFELRAAGDSCQLTFTHTIDDRDVSARTAAGWDRCFARFDALLAGVPMDGRASLELWPLVHERYAERFRVDPEIGRSAYRSHPEASPTR